MTTRNNCKKCVQAPMKRTTKENPKAICGSELLPSHTVQVGIPESHPAREEDPQHAHARLAIEEQVL